MKSQNSNPNSWGVENSDHTNPQKSVPLHNGDLFTQIHFILTTANSEPENGERFRSSIVHFPVVRVSMSVRVLDGGQRVEGERVWHVYEEVYEGFEKRLEKEDNEVKKQPTRFTTCTFHTVLYVDVSHNVFHDLLGLWYPTQQRVVWCTRPPR